MDEARERLEALLAEPLEEARRRERAAFEELQGGRPVVLFGVGALGRRVARVLREAGRPAAAFCDNNAARHGQTLEGLTVLALGEAVERFGGGALFVVCVWNPALPVGLREIVWQLRRAGAQHVTPFLTLFWTMAETFLPYYLFDLPSRLLEQADEIRAGLEMWADERSRTLYEQQLRLRLAGDFEALEEPERDWQYFPPDLYTARADECFIDCGAYDGDTVEELKRHSAGRFARVVALECDPANFERLKASQGDERVECWPYAVAKRDGVMRLEATGGADAALSTEGGVEVKCVALDGFAPAQGATFLKMDIEGAEEDALRGAEGLIRRSRPMLAVCVYHRPQDLWRLPRQMRAMVEGYRFFLRQHRGDGLDTVCYGVPRERV